MLNRGHRPLTLCVQSESRRWGARPHPAPPHAAGTAQSPGQHRLSAREGTEYQPQSRPSGSFWRKLTDSEGTHAQAEAAGGTGHRRTPRPALGGPSPWALHCRGASGAARPQLSPSASRTAPRDVHRERDAGEAGVSRGCPPTPAPGQLWSRRWALGRGLNTGVRDPLLGGSGGREAPAPAQPISACPRAPGPHPPPSGRPLRVLLCASRPSLRKAPERRRRGRRRPAGLRSRVK